MRLFSEEVKTTSSSSPLNIIQVKDFSEIFFGVLEVQINEKKYPVEEVAKHLGNPVVMLPLVIEGVEQEYPFLLIKGKQEIFFNENNTEIPTPDEEILEESTEEEKEKIVFDIDKLKRDSVKKAQEELSRHKEILKEQTKREKRKKEKALKLYLESARENLVSEFTDISQRIKGELVSTNDDRFSEIKESLDNRIQDLADSLNESLKKDFGKSSQLIDKSIKQLVKQLVKQLYEKNINPKVDKELHNIAVEIHEKVSEIDKNLNSKLDKKADRSLVEGVSKEIDTIRDANIELNNSLNKGVQKALSRVGNVDKKIVSLSEEFNKKIEENVKNISEYYDERLRLLEERKLDISEESRGKFIRMISESKEGLLKEIRNMAKDKPVEYVLESYAEKKSDGYELIEEKVDKKIHDKFESYKTELRKYVMTFAGGGGTVAMQFADGGTMNGDLNVTGAYLSAGVNLLDIFSGGSGGGSGGSDVSSLSANWQNTYTTVQSNSAIWNGNSGDDVFVSTKVRSASANWDSTYTTVQANSATWGEDEKVKFNSGDTTAGYLEDKTSADTGILLYEGLSADENKLKIGLDYFVKNSISMGLISGGELTINADNTKFDISDGNGIIINYWDDPMNPIIYTPSWSGLSAQTVTNLATSTVTFVYVDINGNVVQETSTPTNEDHRDKILLGQLGHANFTNIANIINTPEPAQGTSDQLRDFQNAVGIVNSGNIVSANGVNLQINKSSGIFTSSGINFHTNPKNPSEKSFDSVTGATFRLRTQTGNGATVTNLDVGNYDVGGTITAISGTRFQNFRVFLLESGNIVIQYGQQVYTTMAAAAAAIETETFVRFANLESNATLIGIIIARSNSTDLSDTNQAKFLTVSKFGESLGSAVGISISTLQNAYNNSVDPEITTDSTRGALTLKRGSASDTDDIFHILNGSGTKTFSIDGRGSLSATDIQSLSASFQRLNVNGEYLLSGINLFNYFQSGSDVSSLSANWENTYNQVQSLSASWGIDNSGSNVTLLSSNWQNTYNNMASLSGGWQSSYTTVQANSATWGTGGSGGGGSDVSTLSANWQNTYTSFSTNSANYAKINVDNNFPSTQTFASSAINIANYPLSSIRTGTLFGGIDAGLGITGNTNNSLIMGNSAGRNSANAYNSIVIGRNAGRNASANYGHRTIIGDGACYNSTNAVNIVAIGANANSGASGQSSSVFVGFRAGANSSASYGSNVGVGGNAGYGMTSTQFAVAIGNGAGGSGSSRNGSVSIGRNSGSAASNTQYSNFIGHSSGYGASGASYSNFIGRNAGNNADNARHSVFIGTSSGVNCSLSACIALGSFSTPTAHNQLVLGSSTYPLSTTNSDTELVVNINGVLKKIALLPV